MILRTLWLAMFCIVAPLALAKGAFQARLTGAEEVPPVETKGHGNIVVKANPSGASYTLVVNQLENVWGAHIHCAPAGANGPVGLTLFMGAPVTVNGVLAQGPISGPNPGNGCGWETLEDMVWAIESGGAYVNVHTSSVPSGEIRGQL